MRVTWSDRALKTLAAIHGQISKDSEEQAHRVIDRILKRGDQLEASPSQDELSFNHPNVREIIESPYRIVYRVRKHDIEIIEVLHGARRPRWEK